MIQNQSMISPERAMLHQLLGIDHIEHAIHQGGKEHNHLPTTLATFFLLGAQPARLREIYDLNEEDLEGWKPSPGPIVDADEAFSRLGDIRFQRAYMDHFSLRHTLDAGYATNDWVAENLTATNDTGRVLLHGLLSRSGRSLVLLSDSFRIPTALMVVQALTLAAVDWSPVISEMVTQTCISHRIADNQRLSPADIINRIGQDPTFSNVRPGRRDNGYSVMDDPLKVDSKKQAIVKWVRCLDVSDLYTTCKALAQLSVWLACATHKPGQPAFDAHLARLPALVVALRVLLDQFATTPADSFPVHYRFALTRGVFMLMVITYVTQLRPRIDTRHPYDPDNPVYQTDQIWDRIRGNVQEERQELGPEVSKWEDPVFLRLVHSMQQLSLWYGCGLGTGSQAWYRRMATHVVNRWSGWCGLGRPGEEYLDIRL